MREPVRILSDLHLGHPASRVNSVDALRPLLEGAGTLVFNGDTWQELSRTYRESSARMLGDLQRACGELGADPVFLSGNHDPGWPGKGWVELAEGRVVVTHGDAVMWGGSPWSRESFQRAAQVRALWEEHREAECDAGERLQLAREMARVLKAPVIPKGRRLWQRATDAISPPKRALMILHAWIFQADEAERFAERYFPRAEVLVIGHFHRAGIWHRGDRVVVNTGALVHPHAGRWVEWRGSMLRCGRILQVDGAFGLGGADAVWHFG